MIHYIYSTNVQQYFSPFLSYTSLPFLSLNLKMNIYRVYSCIYFFYLSIMFDNCWYSYSLLFSLYQRNLSGCQHTSPLDCFKSSWLGNYTWTLKTWWEEFCIKTSEFYLLLNCWYLLLVQITMKTKQTIILLVRVVEMVLNILTWQE